MDILKIYKRLYNYFGPQHWWPVIRESGIRNQELGKFEICVGAILTQNTAWKNVEKALDNLCAAETMTPEAILRIKKEKLTSLIRPAGYYHQKAKKLKIFAKWFLYFGQKKHKLPNLREEILALWGVGPETADSIALYAYNLPTFVIDAYTKRLCSVFGKNFINYDDYKKYFERNLPSSPKLYNEYHALIVAWGKMYSNKKTSAAACKLIGA